MLISKKLIKLQTFIKYQIQIIIEIIVLDILKLQMLKVPIQIKFLTMYGESSINIKIVNQLIKCDSLFCQKHSFKKQSQHIIYNILMIEQGKQKLEIVGNDKNMDELKTFVRYHGPQIMPPDRIRQKYYSKLNIDFPNIQNLQKKQEVQKGEMSLNIFAPKTGDQIRNRYINKLINMGIMKEPTKKYQHLFIFDWDDTLLCTSFLSALNFLDLTPEVKDMIKKLDEIVEKLLNLTSQRGEVYIITNATKGWVEYSSKLYLPISNSKLVQKCIKIISARSVFGEEYPGDYGRWKIQAFKSIVKKIDTAVLTNMICMGDSNIEIEAAHCLGKEFEKVVVKTIKFRENPRPDEMVKQLSLVVDKFREIFDSNKNLTIRLQRKK